MGISVKIAHGQCHRHGREVPVFGGQGMTEPGMVQAQRRWQHTASSLLLLWSNEDCLHYLRVKLWDTLSSKSSWFVFPFYVHSFPHFINVFPVQKRIGYPPRAQRKGCFSVQNWALPVQLFGNKNIVTHIAVQDNPVNLVSNTAVLLQDFISFGRLRVSHIIKMSSL